MIMDYINLECLALNLSLPKTYLKRLVDSGKLPYIDTGNGRKRFQEKAVREALTRIERQAEQVLSKQKPTVLGSAR